MKRSKMIAVEASQYRKEPEKTSWGTAQEQSRHENEWGPWAPATGGAESQETNSSGRRDEQKSTVEKERGMQGLTGPLREPPQNHKRSSDMTFSE